MTRPLERAEPWLDEQIRRRLANFLHLFPGHTAINVRDMTYADWQGLAESTDRHIEERNSAPRRRR